MHRLALVFLMVILGFGLKAQELNCTVAVNAEQTGQSNLQVFKTLKNEVQEFMNKTTWTNQNFKQQERIDCSIVIIVSEFSGDAFSASIQVQSSRPVYNSVYKTPVFNFNDKQFDFRYTEFQPMNYNPNSFDSNLVAVLSYYAYTILGLDAATFQPNGGEPYFEVAKRIVNTAQQRFESGWSAQSGNQSRYQLNEDLLSPNFTAYNDILYAYHRNGLDYMTDNTKEAKQSLAVTLRLFDDLYNNRPNNFLTRIFFDAKADEVSKLFSDGPQINVAGLKSTLNKVAPTKSAYWNKIKF